MKLKKLRIMVLACMVIFVIAAANIIAIGMIKKESPTIVDPLVDSPPLPDIIALPSQDQQSGQTPQLNDTVAETPQQPPPTTETVPVQPPDPQPQVTIPEPTPTPLPPPRRVRRTRAS